MPQPPRYPALTLAPNWAWLTVGLPDGHAGPKDVENRTWSTKYRGPIYIHAASAPGGRLPDGLTFPAYMRGAIIGQAELLDIVEDSDSPWAWPGWKHWKWGERICFPIPIYMPGRQRLWWPNGR